MSDNQVNSMNITQHGDRSVAIGKDRLYRFPDLFYRKLPAERRADSEG